VLCNKEQAAVRIFKSRWFQRFARREEISDEALPRGRIARPGQGRSKGYRAIVFFRRGSRAYFMYGFAKSERANIDNDETVQFKEAARHVLGLTEKQLAELLKRGDFVAIKGE
jgi:hypothetical protein